jgi:pimeloyl-ACP methyl ester carboxylesterase
MARSDRVRRTLYYPATYLTLSALGMLIAPITFLRANLSTVDYDPAIVRMCGLFVLGLAGFVIQTIRHRLSTLHTLIIGVRVVFCTGYVVLYAMSGNPFFLAVLAVVGAGVVASSIAWLRGDGPREAVPIPSDLTIDANGKRFAALAWGEGPVVLLLHGFPDTAHTWSEIGPAIARAGYRVVAPFLRGYPPSELPAKDIDARTLGEDVVALSTALSPEPIRVVGHDWGADAVHAALALAPERFLRAVTIAIPHRAPLKATPALIWKLRHFITLRLPGAARRFAADDFASIEVLWKRWSPTWNYTDADLAPVKQVLSVPGALDAALGYYRASSFRLPEVLRPPIDVPTRAIAGADDPNAPVELFERAGAQFRAGYDVVAIPGGHFCHRESPVQATRAIVEFLGSSTSQ